MMRGKRLTVLVAVRCRVVGRGAESGSESARKMGRRKREGTKQHRRSRKSGGDFGQQRPTRRVHKFNLSLPVLRQ
jgi:hypothetical protein